MPPDTSSIGPFSARAVSASSSVADFNRDQLPGQHRFFAIPTMQTECTHQAPEGAMAGATIGGFVGAIIAAVSAVGAALTLPALDLVIHSPWAAAAAGGGFGVAGGGLIGALVGYAMVEERPALATHALARRRAPTLRRRPLP